MASTVQSITTAAYVDCGAGPLTVLGKTGNFSGNMLMYIGPTTPGTVDTNSSIVNETTKSIDYGGTDHVFLKSISGTVSVVVAS